MQPIDLKMVVGSNPDIVNFFFEELTNRRIPIEIFNKELKFPTKKPENSQIEIQPWQRYQHSNYFAHNF